MGPTEVKKGIEWGPQTHLEIFPTLVVNFRFISIIFFTDFFNVGFFLKLLLNLLLLFYVLGCFFFFFSFGCEARGILTPDQEWDPHTPCNGR